MRALVTGGLAGIGRALVHRLVGEGIDVVVLDLAKGEDVADSRVWQQVEHVDLAFLNAGVQTGVRDIAALSESAYRRVLATNIDGVVFGVRRLAEVMTPGGSIVVTGSDAGLWPTPRDPVYGLTKAAIVAFVRSIAPFLQERGIRINVICPRAVDTAMIPEPLRRRLREEGELLRPDAVAEAALSVARNEATGRAWLVSGEGLQLVDRD